MIIEKSQFIKITDLGIPSIAAIKPTMPQINEYKEIALINDQSVLKPMKRIMLLYKPNLKNMKTKIIGATNIDITSSEVIHCQLASLTKKDANNIRITKTESKKIVINNLFSLEVFERNLINAIHHPFLKLF
jgi:hypothetical protein